MILKECAQQRVCGVETRVAVPVKLLPYDVDPAKECRVSAGVQQPPSLGVKHVIAPRPQPVEVIRELEVDCEAGRGSDNDGYCRRVPVLRLGDDSVQNLVDACAAVQPVFRLSFCRGETAPELDLDVVAGPVRFAENANRHVFRSIAEPGEPSLPEDVHVDHGDCVRLVSDARRRRTAAQA